MSADPARAIVLDRLGFRLPLTQPESRQVKAWTRALRAGVTPDEVAASIRVFVASTPLTEVKV